MVTVCLIVILLALVLTVVVNGERSIFQKK